MLDVTGQFGLTTEEASERRQEIGPNAIPDSAPRPLLAFVGKFWAPVPCLLEAAIVLQLSLGEYVEACIIAGLLIFNAAIGFFHERRAQATIAALKSRLALNASVRRDGFWKIIPAAELVPGDIIKLSLGGIAAADAHLLEGSVLLDHSMLLYGSSISDGNAHTHHDLPLALVGGAAGQIKGGRHIRYAPETPMNNLLLTMLDKAGVRAETLGDATGEINQLSDV